jgi:hypothetical protein
VTEDVTPTTRYDDDAKRGHSERDGWKAGIRVVKRGICIEWKNCSNERG